MPAIDPFEAERKALTSLMGENRFFIPDLQRPFSWEDEQVDDLLNDIEVVLSASLKSNDPSDVRGNGHFLGTIVTQSEPGRNRLAILDGQQRLTCLTLLISRVAKEARDLLGRCSSEAERLRVKNVVDELERLILLPPDGHGKRSPRLEASPEIRETLNSYVNGGDGEIPTETTSHAMHLRSAARLIVERLLSSNAGDSTEVQIRYFVALQRCICEQLLTIHMTTRAGDAAFSIFESLNARGEDLSMLALLKIWVMSEMVGHPKESEVTQSLRKLSLSRFLGDDPDKFFETYFQVRSQGRKAKAKGSRKQKMFSIEFRDKLLKPAQGADPNDHAPIRARIIETFDHATQIRPIYDAIANRKYRDTYTSINKYPVTGGKLFYEHRLDALLDGTLGHDLAIPLLVRAAEVLQGRANEFHALVHDLEKLFFRLKVVSGCHASVFSHAYRSIFKALDDNSYSDNLRISNFQELQRKHSQDEAFKFSLQQNLRYQVDGSNSTIKYFFWMIELYTGNPVKEKTFELDTMSIEHVFPQSGDTAALTNGSDDLHRLGNLCLLTPKENSELYNHPFLNKKAKVLDWRKDGTEMECAHSRDVFVNHDQWGTVEIEQVEEALLDRAVAVFSF